jgi:hypothetical protein
MNHSMATLEKIAFPKPMPSLALQQMVLIGVAIAAIQQAGTLVIFN